MNIMKFVPVALPVLGLIGFVNHIEWLFYVAGDCLRSVQSRLRFLVRFPCWEQVWSCA